MSEQKVTAWNNALSSNFLLQEVSNHRKFFRDSKNSLENHAFPQFEYSNGVKPSEREGTESGENTKKDNLAWKSNGNILLVLEESYSS